MHLVSARAAMHDGGPFFRSEADMRSTVSRRHVIQSALAAAPALLAAEAVMAQPPAIVAPRLKPNSIPVSELPRHYDVEPGIHNLEAGYWSIMARVVAQAFAANTLYVNRSNSIFGRNVRTGEGGWTKHFTDASAAIARQVGCRADEIAITRSGSDALQMLITNYRGLKPGDAAI